MARFFFHPAKSIAVSIGDPAGIGSDVILDAWVRRNELSIPHFTVLGALNILTDRAQELGHDVDLKEVANGKQAANCAKSLPVISLKNEMQCESGKPQSANSAGIVEAIELGVEKVMAREFCALTTCPINKKELYDNDFQFPGHTEFLGDLSYKLTGIMPFPVMMLAGPQLRTVPVTIHIALTDICGKLTKELIVKTIREVDRDMREKFGLKNPKLAVAGLNPHAGEGGSMGVEEASIIAPALAQLVREKINVVGPLPADTMFHARAREAYDVAICMYHDQALIPAKTLGFDDAVNVTLGLPFIRTSPDHGTAYDLAGTGKAKCDSFVAALKMASDMAGKSAGAIPIQEEKNS